MTQMPGGDEGSTPPLWKPRRRRWGMVVSALVALALLGIGILLARAVTGPAFEEDPSTVDMSPVQPTPSLSESEFPLPTGTPSPSPTPTASVSPSPSATARSTSGSPRATAGTNSTGRPRPTSSPTRSTSTPTPGRPPLALNRTFRDGRLTESSGLAASRLHRGVLWTHNDSGGRPELFAVDSRGRTVARVAVRGAFAADWEALAPGRDPAGRPALYVGDIGDNGERRGSVLVYRVPEPTSLGDGSVQATAFRFRYPDGAHNAETLLVDPRTQRIYIVTKSGDGGEIYAAPSNPVPGRTMTLTRVAGGAPRIITDGTFLPDGRIVLRDYTKGYLSGGLRGPWRPFSLPRLQQAESMATNLAGNGIFLGSEGRNSPVWTVPLP